MSALTLGQEHRGEEIQRPRYDLGDNEISGITQSFLAEQTGLVVADRYACFRVSTESEIANVARTVECRVFDESFGNNPDEMTAEYGPYEAASHFLLSIDLKKRRPAGVVRIIANSPAGIKSINDLREPLGITVEDYKARQEIASLDLCLDFGTLAVLPEYRGVDNRFKVSTMLYRGAFLLAKAEQAEHLVTVIDKQARKGPDLLGVPMRVVNGTDAFSYLGSESSYAMHGYFPEFEPSVIERAKMLKDRAAITIGNILKPKRLIRDRIVATIAGSLATGEGIDTNMRV